MLMLWNESCNLGFPAIDQQHRQLFNMLNELEAAMANGRGSVIAANVIGSLLPLIRNHFAEEEKTLRQLKSPLYHRCCDRHVGELEMVCRFLQDKTPSDPSAVIDLLYFLDTLLDGHIESERRALGLDAGKLIQ